MSGDEWGADYDSGPDINLGDQIDDLRDEVTRLTTALLAAEARAVRAEGERDEARAGWNAKVAALREKHAEELASVKDWEAELIEQRAEAVRKMLTAEEERDRWSTAVCAYEAIRAAALPHIGAEFAGEAEVQALRCAISNTPADLARLYTARVRAEAREEVAKGLRERAALLMADWPEADRHSERHFIAEHMAEALTDFADGLAEPEDA